MPPRRWRSSPSTSRPASGSGTSGPNLWRLFKFLIDPIDGADRASPVLGATSSRRCRAGGGASSALRRAERKSRPDFPAAWTPVMDLSFPPTNQVLSSDRVTRCVQSYSQLHQHFITEWILKRSGLKPGSLGSFVLFLHARWKVASVWRPSRLPAAGSAVGNGPRTGNRRLARGPDGPAESCVGRLSLTLVT